MQPRRFGHGARPIFRPLRDMTSLQLCTFPSFPLQLFQWPILTLTESRLKPEQTVSRGRVEDGRNAEVERAWLVVPKISGQIGQHSTRSAKCPSASAPKYSANRAIMVLVLTSIDRANKPPAGCLMNPKAAYFIMLYDDLSRACRFPGMHRAQPGRTLRQPTFLDELIMRLPVDSSSLVQRKDGGCPGSPSHVNAVGLTHCFCHHGSKKTPRRSRGGRCVGRAQWGVLPCSALPREPNGGGRQEDGSRVRVPAKR
jgi:hypothetical protein